MKASRANFGHVIPIKFGSLSGCSAIVEKIAKKDPPKQAGQASKTCFFVLLRARVYVLHGIIIWLNKPYFEALHMSALGFSDFYRFQGSAFQFCPPIQNLQLFLKNIA